MLVAWFGAVNKESSQGLYSCQLDNTFRWAMLWFLVAELFLFGVFWAIAIHLRFSITPWLAGKSGESPLLTHYLLWPDFIFHWPFITIPEKAPNTTIPFLLFRNHLFFLSLILLFVSALITLLARYFFEKHQRTLTISMLIVILILGLFFFFFQIKFLVTLIKLQVIKKAGIYGSFLIAYLALHLTHVVIALLMWFNIIYRFLLFKIHLSRRFLFDATSGWWIFLVFVGFFEIFFIY